MVTQVFEEISPADFFYRNRDIAGFTNPSRAIFASIRELVENSLDAAELAGAPPTIYIRLTYGEGGLESGVYRLRVEDNGVGITSRHIPSAFGQVLFGSKYKLKQARGTFGLGGTMAVLYGQITTHKPALIVSSTGSTKVYKYRIMVDIQRNRPIILERKILINKDQWHGTIVKFSLEGDYFRAMPKILEYLKQTALVNPYANITFVDPKGRLYKFVRATTKMPPLPKETLPHPYGVDVETVKRLMQMTPHRNMRDFMIKHFHRISEKIAYKFLEFAAIPRGKNPKRLGPGEVVKLVQMMKRFEEFRSPSASCLSPLGEELLKAGILKELKPEFIAVCQRKPSTYAGHPFIIETAIAYGGSIPKKTDFVLYRFANRIPLLYDEASDVSFRVIKSMNWRRYKASPDMPIAVLVHICSTKIPYKTVGKEFIADRPEVKREILNGIREAARKLRRYLSKQEHVEKEKRRLSVFSKYLPKIAKFSTELAGKERQPDIQKLLEIVNQVGRKESRK
ncbi:MAG: DNA topoisomerase VI subunit B [Candidatus Bathyarchaeota archaeon]|nr:MAG: DNA topoisomerase VI subunit B [Candidatus Bathyarchaeota archaeon]